MLNIIQKQTPNFAVGRSGYKPEIIVLHIMDGTLGATDDWFMRSSQLEGKPVSANYGIGLKGEIHQYVKDLDTAWAQGRVDHPTSKIVASRVGVNPNKYCLSIEHEGKDLSHGTKEQLQASASLVRALATQYSIPLDRDHIIGHKEIFSLKPFCPSENLAVIDAIISMAKSMGDPVPGADTKVAEPTTAIQVPNSKVDRVLAYLKTI